MFLIKLLEKNYWAVRWGYVKILTLYRKNMIFNNVNCKFQSALCLTKYRNYGD